MCKDLELGAVSFDRNNIIPKDISLRLKNYSTLNATTYGSVNFYKTGSRSQMTKI